MKEITDEEYDKNQNYLLDCIIRSFYKYFIYGNDIGAFKDGFNSVSCSKSQETKDKWILYRDARNIYLDFWKKYQEGLEEKMKYEISKS